MKVHNVEPKYFEGENFTAFADSSQKFNLKQFVLHFYTVDTVVL